MSSLPPQGRVTALDTAADVRAVAATANRYRPPDLSPVTVSRPPEGSDRETSSAHRFASQRCTRTRSAGTAGTWVNVAEPRPAARTLSRGSACTTVGPAVADVNPEVAVKLARTVVVPVTYRLIQARPQVSVRTRSHRAAVAGAVTEHRDTITPASAFPSPVPRRDITVTVLAYGARAGAGAIVSRARRGVGATGGSGWVGVGEGVVMDVGAGLTEGAFEGPDGVAVEV
jgi:hypothetical protein